MMMKLIKKLKQILSFFLFFKKNKKIDKLNAKLEEALIEHEKSKRKLRKKIIKHFNRQYYFGSKFIKQKGKSKHHIQTECLEKFGEEMSEIGLKLTDKLELK